jgi:hypothetical protein
VLNIDRSSPEAAAHSTHAPGRPRRERNEIISKINLITRATLKKLFGFRNFLVNLQIYFTTQNAIKIKDIFLSARTPQQHLNVFSL